MALPYVLIYPKELKDKLGSHLDGVLPFMHVVGEIDGDTVYFIKNRLGFKSEVKVKDFQAELNSMMNFLAE
jgi:hypothetical protein